MRFLVSTILILATAVSAMGDEVQFAHVVKAGLIFHDDFDAARPCPHTLKVFLRLDNAYDSDVGWVANATRGIEAALFDAASNPVPEAPFVASIQSNPYAYLLPFGSRLDWLISHGGISMMGDTRDKYALIVGCRGWLIPIATASSYSLRIRLRGLPWTHTEPEARGRPLKLLLDLPPIKLNVTPNDA